MKTKPLPTQEYLLSILKYDEKTGHLYWMTRSDVNTAWNTKYAGKRAFTAIDKKGYHVGAINNSLYRAQRIIFKMLHGYDPEQVDHDNGNTVSNTPDNLIDVTHQQNQRNMKRSKANKSGVTGVCWNTEKNKWQASIMVNKRQIVIIRSEDINVCIAARKQAEIDYNFNPNHGR